MSVEETTETEQAAEVVTEEVSTPAVEESTQEAPTVETETDAPSSVEEGTGGETDPGTGYKETGNKTIDSVGKIVSESGLDFSNYAKELESQLGSDGFELSEESFKELTDKFGEGVATLLEEKLVGEYTTLKEQSEAIRTVTYDAFGGEEKLKALGQTFLDEGILPKEDLDKLGHMLAAGGIEQTSAIKTIKEAYMSSSAFEQNPQFVNDGEQAKPEGTQPLSRAEYVKEKLSAMKAGDLSKVESLNKRAQFTMDKHSQLWR